MNAKDLMICDWVFDKILKSNAKVEALQPLTIRCDIHTEHHLYKEFDPVPLTPEILEANGFEKSDRWENYYVRKNVKVDEFGNVWNVLVLCDDLLFCELHIHIGEDPYDPDDSYCMPDFQFVHELQQKLRSNKLREIADSFIL